MSDPPSEIQLYTVARARFLIVKFSDHNSTFEQLHGSSNMARKESYTTVLDDYLHSTVKATPSPKRRQSLKPRPPPKPVGLMSSPQIATIQERIESIELEKKTPPRPAPRKRKGKSLL